MKRIRFTGDMDEGNCVVAVDLLNGEGFVAHEIDEVTLDLVTDVDDALRTLRNRGLPFRIAEV